MKKLFSLLLIILIITSCKKDILDITPTDRLSETAIWTDATLPQLFVNAQYNTLQHGFNNDVQYYGDEAYSKFNDGGYQLIGLNQINPSNVDQISGRFNYWKDAYNTIRNFNIFFSKIDGTPLTDENKIALSAEVKFLRAFVYAQLIWNYGGVPIVEKIYTLNEDLKGLKRNSYEECVNYILKDLDAAIAGLPDQQTGANAGRASADAARALKARVLLYYASPQNNPAADNGRWQQVYDAAFTLISSNRYTLSDNYHNLFIGGENKEAIFSRYFSTDNSHQIGKQFAPTGSGGNGYGQPSQNLVDAYEMINGIIPVIDGAVNPDPSNTFNPANPYINRDPRFYASVLYNGATYKNRTIEPFVGGADFFGPDATATGYYNYKFLDQNQVVSNSTPYTYPWHFFRLAEIYLIYAEASYHLGKEDVTREYINKVRQRVGVNMPPVTETGTALFNRLVHERQIELAFEGHRFYDTRRWKIAPQVDAKAITGVQVVKNAGGTFSYNRLELLKRVWDDRLYLIPLSFQQVQASGGSLIQNPGYN
jgi:hypothetical protein